MRKVIIFSILILLSGCTTAEQKISNYTEGEIKEEYGEEVKVISVKEKQAVGSTFVIVLSELFGKEYDLTFKSVKEPNFTFNGDIHGDLKDFYEDFLNSKHEYLLKHNEDYMNKNEIVSKNGLSIVTIDGYSKDGIVMIEIYGYYNGNDVNTEQLVERLYDMASLIVQTPNKVSVAFTLEPKTEYTYFDIQTNEYSKNNKTELEKLLKEQFTFIQNNQRVNEEINKKLKQLNLFASSNLKKQMDYSRNQADLFMEQKITIDVNNEYNKANLLKAFDIFRDAGLDEALVELSFANGYTNSCKVREVKTVDDIDRCYQ